MTVAPCLVRSMVGGEVRAVTLGHLLLDDYLEFVAARARPNTLLAAAFDLKVFFTVIDVEPSEVHGPESLRTAGPHPRVRNHQPRHRGTTPRST